MKTKRMVALVALTTTMLYPCAALADGIDLVAYFSRTPCEKIVLAIPIAALLMLLNYGLNYLVIGLPARRLGSLPVRQVVRSLIWLTLLGQVADRIGAFLAILLAGPITSVLGLEGEVIFLVIWAFNFIFSAIGIALLAFVFARFAWRLSVANSLVISSAAGILTNPAWAMALWSLG